jgi:hydroxymethylglutaryl-CoA synthase
MIGITAYGAYIPAFRLSRDLMAKAWGRGSIGGERSVANNDEDSATMAVEAVFDCLRDGKRDDLGGLFFASTTAPYREKEISSLVATTADFPTEILTADFANSLRAGAAALRSALDAVSSGSAKNLMVVAADCRLGYPQSESEQAFGDGAAALSIGSSGVIATLEGHYAISNEMMDVWRNADDSFVRSWESRWVLGEGYSNLMEQALSGLMKKKGLDAKRVSRFAFPAPDARTHRRLAQTLGFDLKTQVIDSLLGQVGDCGAAHPLMLLVSALEAAKPGDTILLGAYGNGAEAFLFEVTGEAGCNPSFLCPPMKNISATGGSWRPSRATLSGFCPRPLLTGEIFVRSSVFMGVNARTAVPCPFPSSEFAIPAGPRIPSMRCACPTGRRRSSPSPWTIWRDAATTRWWSSPWSNRKWTRRGSIA